MKIRSAMPMLILLMGCAKDTSAPLCPPSWQEQVEGLDPRTPYPVDPREAWRQNQSMQRFLQAVEGITRGLAAADYEAVERDARVLGPVPGSRCDETSTAEGIHALAQSFRCGAQSIQDAARARDESAVLRALSNTLTTCNGCHSAYRQTPTQEFH